MLETGQAMKITVLTATGYFITDAVLNYTKPKYEIGLVINNMFNTQWKETQFDTETRLKNESHLLMKFVLHRAHHLAPSLVLVIFLSDGCIGDCVSSYFINSLDKT